MALTTAQENIVKALETRAALLADIDAINADAILKMKAIDDKRNADIAAKAAAIAALNIPRGM